MSVTSIRRSAWLGMLVVLIASMAFSSLSDLTAGDRNTHNVLGVFGTTSS